MVSALCSSALITNSLFASSTFESSTIESSIVESSLLVNSLSASSRLVNTIEQANKTPVKYPQRIIALSPHSVELLYAIGAGEKIVGVITHSDYPDAAKKIEEIGDHRGITMEKLISLKPDLVVTWSSNNKINQVEQIKKLGFNVVNSDPQTLNAIASDLRLLGEVTGHLEQAEKVAKKFELELATLTQKYQDRKPVKTFYQLWSKPLMTISKNSWINQFITRCGGINVFHDATSPYPKISTENILLSKAEIILIPDDTQTRSHELFNWNQWDVLPAVKNKQIYYPNAKILHRPTPRVLGPMKEVCEFIENAR